ncbi:MAG: hypothetical protein ACXV3D_09815, partial [Halobacteriota archaeon]
VPSDMLLRASPSDGFNHGLAVGGFPVGLLIVGSSSELAFAAMLPPGAFGRLWHLAAEAIPPPHPNRSPSVIAITP